ncbi:MAG: ABC-F family ATP-binding cassette domain-containing protein [Lachnospiraceae bacterium]|nr:ABC-F family ATP-binding cassette domain-containing protein [Lachnospiraceae bacterium]
MNILTVEKITKMFGEKKIFDEADFYLEEGDKVGIVGINGTGKSTLLKIIAGLEEADQGQVIRANHVVISYLKQQPDFLEQETVMEYVLREAGKNHMTANLESNAKTMMTKLEIKDFNQKMGELSGGQKKRVSLVASLLAPSDILILDEPTNHIDNEMSDWLESYLEKYKGALIMVTHDRYFLDSVCNRIDEVDKGKIYSYHENYSGFLQLKMEREEMAVASDRKRKSIMRNELAWIMRGARARSTKQKARIQRFEEMKNTSDFAYNEKVEISSAHTRLGKTTVELDHICMSYDERVLIQDFSYIFLKNDRVGFVGRNGSGKTTLMKIIAGRIQPVSGTVTVGQTVKIGYYSQEIENSKEAGIAYMNPQMRVIDYIRETAEYVKTKDGQISASQMLEKFLFSGEDQYGLIGKLSGGEKRRLNLLRVLMEAPNVLILDEPTNDLDITTLTILEDYLDNFEGIVIIVSHDRYFLDRTVRRIFAFEKDGKIKQYEGGYTDYSIKKKNTETEEPTGETVSKPKVKYKPEREKKLKFSYKEQKEYEVIEKEVSDLEEKIEELEKSMEEFATDFYELNKLTVEKEETEKLLEEKMSRWMYLEELNEKILNQ